MFNVDTAIDTKADVKVESATPSTKSVLAHTRSPAKSQFSLSLSQVSRRHDYVKGNSVCLIRVTLKTAQWPLTCDVKMYFDSQV